jgi:hypothetical protein
MKNKNSIKRMVKIYQVLEQNECITIDEIVSKVNQLIDFPVCKSSIEKDIFNLKMDFDIEIKGNMNGVMLVEKIDIEKKVLQYLGL